MTHERHALSSVAGLLQARVFYASAMDQAPGIHRVYALAQKGSWPQLELANSVAKHIAASPPSYDSKRAMGLYIKKNILSRVPQKTRYDDVFWCCLLHVLDAEGVPECSIGGPFHEFIYKVYDDFDPADVTG